MAERAVMFEQLDQEKTLVFDDSLSQKRQHLLYDLWLAEADPLEQPAAWRDLLCRAARESGATIITSHFHQFEPVGFTGFLLLAESHLSIHTWPEERLAALDIFTCGPVNPMQIVHQIRTAVQPTTERLKWVERG